MLVPILTAISIFIVLLSFMLKPWLVVIKYKNKNTRVVANFFTETKYIQALDHYGWFNLKKINDGW
jgi:hypothetical protein